MPETLTDLHNRALALEAQMQLVMQTAADAIIPPFVPKTRARLREAFGVVHMHYAQLNGLWLQHLGLPQTRDQPYNAADRVYFGGLRRRLNLWLQLHQLLQTTLAARALPILAEPAPLHGPQDRQLYAYQAAFYRLHEHMSPPRPRPEDHIGMHNDIPLQFTLFARLIQLARRTALALGHPTPLRFLDVGSGVGLKVLQAAQVFEVAQGLEYDVSRVAVAQNLMQHPLRRQDKVFQANALSYDGYAEFDVIYAYKPLSAIDLLIQMETRIVAQARPGTVLVLPYSEFEERAEGLGCGRVAPMVYVTGQKGRSMRPLLGKIARIGFVVPEAAHLRTFDDGFVAPLANALRHWGYLD